MKNIKLQPNNENEEILEKDKAVKKKKSSIIRPAIVCLIALTLICGVIYPLSVTLISNTLFPYEANGSQIVVTLKDGTEKIYGSELIGQNYEDAKYLFGRVNINAPTNLSPESDEYKAIIEERIASRKEKLANIGYTDIENIPDELLTTSGSGVDPHISPDTAKFQAKAIVMARRNLGENITEDYVLQLIDKYTEGRFLLIFGEKRVNALLVNLALDGLI